MSDLRNCPKCGAQVSLVHMLKTGQRVLVNDGFVPVFLGSKSGGGIAVGRVLHWQTCPAHAGVPMSDELVRVTNDGAWKSQETDDEEGFGSKGQGKRGEGRKRKA